MSREQPRSQPSRKPVDFYEGQDAYKQPEASNRGSLGHWNHLEVLRICGIHVVIDNKGGYTKYWKVATLLDVIKFLSVLYYTFG